MGSPEKPGDGPPERIDTVRRALVAGIAAAALFPKDALAARTYEDTPARAEDLAYFHDLLRDPQALTQFQQNPTRAQLEQVIRVLAISSADWVPNIERQQEQLHAGARALFNSSGGFLGNGTVLRIQNPSEGARREAPYRYVLVTAAHVAENEAEYGGWTTHPGGADVAVRELTPKEASVRGRIDALHLGTTQDRLNLDISGKVGVVLARDSDTGVLKRKLYESMVSPRTKEIHLPRLGASRGNLLQRDDLRLIILPRGEERILPGGGRPAQGVSGAAFLFVPPGAAGVEFAGIFVSVLPPIKIGEQAPYAVGHIVDHVIVREAINHLFSRSR